MTQLPQIFFPEFREPNTAGLSAAALDALGNIRKADVATKDAEREVVEAQADVTAALARVTAAEKLAPKYGFNDLWKETFKQQ